MDSLPKLLQFGPSLKKNFGDGANVSQARCLLVNQVVSIKHWHQSGNIIHWNSSSVASSTNYSQLTSTSSLTSVTNELGKTLRKLHLLVGIFVLHHW